tara:strand:+ start:310 stop:798 length:489 start_codon:yes stop_codon:yes gene_type:complete
MKKKYKDYADYLKSDKWKQVKSDYAENNNHLYCALCGSDSELQHHHFNYPKDWNDDSHLNIIKICGECHDIAHQEEHENETLIDFISDMSPLLSGNNHDNGIVIGQDDVLSKILAMGMVDVVRFNVLTDKNSRAEYRIKIDKGLTDPCNFIPLSIWGDITNG